MQQTPDITLVKADFCLRDGEPAGFTEYAHSKSSSVKPLISGL